MRRAQVLLAALALGACSSSAAKPPADGGRDVSVDYVYVDPRTDVCSDGGAAPTYDVMQRIFDENCVTCHTVGADLDLAAGVSWANLVGQPPPPSEACGGTLVVAGDPGASYLYQKLTSSTPCYGQRMPLSEFGPAPQLPDCVLSIIHDWIAEGAPGPSADAGPD